MSFKCVFKTSQSVLVSSGDRVFSDWAWLNGAVGGTLLEFEMFRGYNELLLTPVDEFAV